MSETDDFTDELVAADILIERAATTLRGVGMPVEHARWMAEWLVDSDLNGVRTHGLRLLPQYVERARHGGINVNPSIRTTSRRTSVVTVDGDNGFGQVVATVAMREAIERASVTGTVTATVLNSNHLGALSYLARMATAQRMFVFACQNTRNNLVPWGGRRPVMGNNPMVWGLPLAGDEAMVLDMASSRTANGRLKLAKDRGESIELGWAVDPDGNPTADPALGLRGGLMPFGEHKGSGIAIFAGALSGVLSGANFGATLPAQDDYDNPVRSLGHFIYLVDVEALLPWEEYVSRMSRYLAEIKSAGSAVSLPGERSTANRAKAQAAGVPVERRLLRFMA